MLTFSFIIFFAFFCKFFQSSNGITYVDPGFTRLEYSYATSIVRPYLSKNITNCSFIDRYRCFMVTMDDTVCQRNMIKNFDAVGEKYIDGGELVYATKIRPYLFECLAKKFTKIEQEKRYLWILDGLNKKKQQKQLNPNCFELLKNCNECQPSFPSYVLNEIIKDCSDEAFKHANVSSFSKRPEPSPIFELDKLSLQKIGSIATSTAAEHLTFNDLENMKFIASKNRKLEAYLCLSDSTTELDYPDLSHKWFTLDEYKAVKNLLKENQSFRWFICSGIYAITSASDLVCFPSKLKNCEDILQNLPAAAAAEEDVYTNLQKCRKLAKADALHHGAICS